MLTGLPSRTRSQSQQPESRSGYHNMPGDGPGPPAARPSARPSCAGAGPQRARPSLAGVAAGHVTARVCMHAGRCVRALLSCAGVRPVGPRSRSWRRSPGAEAAGARGSCRTSTGLAELGRSRASTGPVELGRSRHRRCCGIRACTRADACAHDCGF